METGTEADVDFDYKVEKKEETYRDIKEEKTPGCYIKARHVMSLMGFLAGFNLYSMRNNISVAIVAMVNSTNGTQSNNNSEGCPDRGLSEIDDVTSNGIFNWNSAEQGLVLGCYFYGYVCTCIPGGYLAKRFGIRLVLGTSMLLSSIVTLLSPLAAYYSFELFVACRILLGFLQGVVSPAIQSAWSKWAPPLERSRLISFASAGSSFGTFATLPIIGFISNNFGWEPVFYFTGGIALIWSLFFIAIIHNTPEEHPRISDQEKTYIVESIGEIREKHPVKVRTPWIAMMTSLPLWGIMAAHFANNWENSVLMSMLPTYMTSILKFNLSASGALASLPYIIKFIITIVGGYVTDFCHSKRLASITVLRKINTCLALIIPAIFIVLAGYIGCDVTAAVAFFTLSLGFTGFSVPGAETNTIDIAPKYNGITYGISNTLGNMAGFLAPQIVGFILIQDDSISQWQNVFWLTAGINFVGATIYLILGTGEEQPWANGKIIDERVNYASSNEAHEKPLDENTKTTKL